MGALLDSLGCCIWWFLAGVTLGWLLNRWLCKCCCKKPNLHTPQAAQKTPPSQPTTAPTPPAASASKLLETLVASVATEPAKTAASEKKPAKAKAPAKPKSATKPKTAAKPKAASKPKSTALDVAAAKLAGFSIKADNDLTVIEGIGPKINTLFLDAGIQTFAQLASTTVPEMRRILDNAGPRYRIANPSTWAEQAALAADNKWAELKKLQDALSAGVKK
jgi:predicted flap endonuclease-1-like 5' DNA nuclease